MTELRPDELRVSDDERRAVDAQLHRAVGEGRLSLLEYEERAGLVWAARTRGELAVVTRDLPAPHRTGGAVADGLRRAVAVLGEERVGGPFAPGERVEGWALLGQAHLDLDRADLPGQVEVRVVSVLGQVEVRVPPGAHVQLVGGASVLGERTVRTSAPVVGGPVVRISATAVLGSVQVRSGDVPSGLAAVVQRGVAAGAPAAVVPGPARVAPGAVVPARGRGVGRRLVGLLAAGALLVGGAAAVEGTVLADDAVAFMSGVELQAEPDEETQVGVLMGGAQVVVPAGARGVQVDVGAVMGGADVVLLGRPADQVVIDARTVMGGVSVLVPEGVTVELEGRALMGGTSCSRAACASDGVPDVLVVGRALMGGVEVHTASAQEIRERLDQAPGDALEAAREAAEEAAEAREEAAEEAREAAEEAREAREEAREAAEEGD